MTVRWTPEAATEAIRRGALRGITAAANLVRNEVLRLILETPKTGKIYVRRGIEHQASAPGEAPASDTGTLVRGITVEIDTERIAARVNSGAAHGPHLEFGTDKMEPRPHMRQALENKRVEIEATVGREVAAALTVTFG